MVLCRGLFRIDVDKKEGTEANLCPFGSAFPLLERPRLIIELRSVLLGNRNGFVSADCFEVNAKQ